MKIVAGVSAQVPQLVAFMVNNTGDEAPDNALYVGIYDDAGIWGCLIFYSPLVEGGLKGVKFGGALAPGKTWGNSMLTFIDLRERIEEIVFSGFGYDFVEADVRGCNERTIRFLRAAGFALMSPDRKAGIATYRYELPRSP